MPLEELISLIERLKIRIDQHGVLLRQNEALTRYALIDPMLRELGWETGDPGMVRPEYRDAGGNADYALMRNNRPVALVEAKKLGEPLASGTEQVLNYCNQQGINYMVVTDGDRWELYEVFRQARIEDRKLMSFSIRNEQGYECALKALHLWQPNLSTVTSMTKPPEPMVVTIPSDIDPPSSVRPTSTVQTPTPTSTTSSTIPGWTPISDVRPVGGAKAPSAIRFPGGEEKQIRYWNGVLVEVAEWMSRTGVLTVEKCPIGRGYERHIIHSEARHPNGKDFFQPRQIASGLFVEAHVSAAKAVEDARFLMNHLGQDISRVEVQVG